MRSLPLRARIFLYSVFTLGLAAGIAAWFWRTPRGDGSSIEFALALVLAALAGGKKVRLMRSKGADEDVGSMSLGFAITFAAMLRFGPSAGVVVGITSCFTGCIYPRRQPAHQLLFN